MYSEEGGQESDSGRLIIEDKIIFNIRTVVNINDCIVHFGKFENPSESELISVNNIGIVEVDSEKRSQIMKNHTALHLLNAALRNVLTVTSQISAKVTAEKFSLTCSVYRENIDREEIEKIEKMIRNVIRHDVAVRRRTVLRNELESLDSITLVPGESFPKPEVTVVEVNSGYFSSKEPCFGTHVLNTSEIQEFVVVSNKFISTGRRLLEGVTGDKAIEIRNKYEKKFEGIKKLVLNQSKIDLSQAEKLYKDVNSFGVEMKNAVQGMSDWKRKKFIDEEKEIKRRLKIATRAWVMEDFKDFIANNQEKFVVHVYPNIPKFVDIDFHQITITCKNKPILLFLREDDDLTVCSSVPEVDLYFLY